MMERQEGFTIGAFAKAAGVNVETIRFYQRRRLLARPPRPGGGVRRYREADIARVRFIKSGQRLGFSLDDVGALLILDDGTHCHEAHDIGALKLADVRAKLTELKRIERLLSKLMRACEGRRGNVSCPLIAALQRA